MAWSKDAYTTDTPSADLSDKLKDLCGGSGVKNWSFVENVPAGLTIIARDGTPSNGWGEPARKLAWRVSGHLPAFKQSTQPSAALMRALRG